MPLVFLLLAWPVVSWAQELPPLPEATEEVVVWGEQHVRQARAAVIRSMENLGWTAKAMRRGEVVVFRPPEPWMGKAFLEIDGRLRFGRPVLAVEPALVQGTYRTYNAAQVLDRQDTNGIAAGPSATVLPSKAKLATVHRQVRAALSDELAAYETVFRETQFRVALGSIPARLDALMATGAALDGSSTVLTTDDERRRALLDFWSNLADDPDGLALSESVETWIREVLQHSQSPLSDDEIRAAESRRADGRALIQAR